MFSLWPFVHFPKFVSLSSEHMSVFFFVSANIFRYLGSILSMLLDPHQGAFYGIMVGHVCGVIRMAMDFAYPGPGCDEEETRPSVLFLSLIHI